MRFVILLLAFTVAACGFQPSRPDESSVTVTLPPPKGAPTPGFSAPVPAQG